jgi:putative ABC transport system permease protein
MLADLRIALRSLLRARGLALTVTITLALGIGANAAMFTVVRGVLLRPLVNRDESRLIYIRQSAPGAEVENTTFSVPEIDDLQKRMKTVSAVGDFSVVGFTLLGLGEPRVLRAGVVSGEFFKVMGLRPIRGRLIGVGDDGPTAAPVVVLTHRFWTAMGADSTVIGKQVRLNAGTDRLATIIGILEPSVPYPTETEIIANVVTSPHHMGAVMNTSRTHRMTELFARLAPGATIEQARAELTTIQKGFIQAYPEAYPSASNYQIETRLLRDQIVSRARTILWVLLASSALIFIIACSNVANLILARSVQREAELALRAALGATPGALRRTLLAESVLLGGTGAALGVLLAVLMVPVLSRYAARYSIRALELSIDPTVLWVGVSLALVAAVLLAFVPRLPTADTAGGLGGAAAGMRMTTSTSRRLRAFAVTQVGASFVLLAGASMLLTALITLQRAPTPFETADVLAINVPVMRNGNTRGQRETSAFYRDIAQRVEGLPGVTRAAVGQTVPWRDAGNTGRPVQFTVDGYRKENGEEDPRARFRIVGPGWFETVGLRLIAGRDFTQADADSGAPRTIVVSQRVAQQMAPNIQAIVGHNLVISDSTLRQFLNPNGDPIQIIGVVSDVDDENVIPQEAMTLYQPGFGGRLFVRSTAGNPYALMPAITRLIRGRSPDQPVERAATLEDVKAELISPDRVNTIVFGAFALVALTIAIVGVAGVLAFSVSTRMREFGIRLAVGSEPGQLMRTVLREGAAIAAIGVVVGGLSGIALARIGSAVFGAVRMPGLMPAVGAALLLLVAATLASWMPAAKASRVDVLQALRSD